MGAKKNSVLAIRLILIVSAFVFLLSIGLFYWYEYRPAKVRETCSTFAEKESEKDVFLYEIVYRHCLRKHGIEYSGPDSKRTE
jgi:hypothetical protein